jgi:tRNA 2-thiouridine synthesizing protein E
MALIAYQNKLFEVDEDGHLKRYSDWCLEWVTYVRLEQNIPKLTAEHWEIIHILQDYYQEHGMPPISRIISTATGFKMTRIFELFPQGPGKGACKLAGLPKPKGCV